jgi:hypothetical protein
MYYVSLTSLCLALALSLGLLKWLREFDPFDFLNPPSDRGGLEPRSDESSVSVLPG